MNYVPSARHHLTTPNSDSMLPHKMPGCVWGCLSVPDVIKVPPVRLISVTLSPAFVHGLKTLARCTLVFTHGTHIRSIPSHARTQRGLVAFYRRVVGAGTSWPHGCTQAYGPPGTGRYQRACRPQHAVEARDKPRWNLRRI
jgi:hypothetical protein